MILEIVKKHSLTISLLVAGLILVASGFVLSSCQGIALEDERANLVATQKTFAAVMRSLNKAKEAGQIDEDLKEKLDPVVKFVDENLKLWEEALLNNESRPDLQEQINTNIILLQETLKDLGVN